MITQPTPTPIPLTTTNNASAAEGLILPMFTSDGSATEVALSLLQGVLALF
jgi:hypothetical protein